MVLVCATKEILHVEFIAMGEKPLHVMKHPIEKVWGAGLVCIPPPDSAFTHLVADNKFILWRATGAGPGVGGEHSMFGEGAIATA